MELKQSRIIALPKEMDFNFILVPSVAVGSTLPPQPRPSSVLRRPRPSFSVHGPSPVCEPRRRTRFHRSSGCPPVGSRLRQNPTFPELPPSPCSLPSFL